MHSKLKNILLLLISAICIFCISTTIIKKNHTKNITDELEQLFTDPIDRCKISKKPNNTLNIHLKMYTQLDESLCTSINNVKQLIENYNSKTIEYLWGDINNLKITVSSLLQGPENIKIEYTKENQIGKFQPQALTMYDIYELQCLKKIDNISNVSEVSITQVFYDNSLDGIQELSNLQELYIYTDKPSIDLSYLSHLKNLNKLGFTIQEGIDDLSPICNIKNLKELNIFGKCDSSQIEEIKKALPKCKIKVI